jgi:hypothetical protein
MGKAAPFIHLALGFAALVTACGGNVVFVAAGSGGAGGATSTAVVYTAPVSVGTCMTCDCMPGGCTDAATSIATTAGVGGGLAGCTTCSQILENSPQSLNPCPGPSQMAFKALADCICAPNVCGQSCVTECPSTMNVDNPNACIACEQMSIAGACAMQASACAAN